MHTLIINASIVNEGRVYRGHILIKDNLINKVLPVDENARLPEANRLIDASGKYLLPGVIDDQVHFREPGLTHKAEIYTEAKAAVAGGTTSYMEMPNTKPQTTTQEALKNKFDRAAEKSLANYSFYMGATNENIKSLLNIDKKSICGIKIFMGSSTGNMLVDDRKTLERIFAEAGTLITTHCEDEATIQRNTRAYHEKYGDNMPIKFHPEIRSHEACYKSSALAVELATKHNARLHILHLSTGKELELFSDKPSDRHKRITAEVCVHHLWFDDSQYDTLGTRIKWNPAVKSTDDRDALRVGLKKNKLDVIATDHAPHTLEEKNNNYFNSPSGGPLVQHSLSAMLELVKQGIFELSFVVEKMCHAPAEIFQVEKRGYIREGYFADLVLVDLNNPWEVTKDNILYKCGWSPFEGEQFSAKVTHTFVNGHLVYDNGHFDESQKGQALTFDR
ncbi:MAG: dihydroorotase [Bacteroidota bacterium]